MRDRRDHGTLDLQTGALLLGYARVSTDDQDLAIQRASLAAAGCSRIYEEKISGAKRNRPELMRLLDHLRTRDILVVTRLDRLARSTRDLLEIGESLQQAGAGLRSLAEPWADTTSPAGKMVLTVFAGVAEFERTLILDRTRKGREAARERGVRFGRKPLLDESRASHARELLEQGKSLHDVAALLNVDRTTIWRALRRESTLIVRGGQLPDDS